MPRHQDWPLRLARFLDARAELEFRWGSHDCALFAADWVLECTGTDHAAKFRGRYSTARGSAGALRRFGAGTLVATVTAALGPPLAAPLLAQRGDVAALVAEDRSVALGVVEGALAVYLEAGGGLARRPLVEAAAAWRV